MTQRIVIPEPHPELIDPSVFIADGAVIRGIVQLGQDVSVWFNAVLRGDVDRIVIGNRSNVQDGARSSIVILVFHAQLARK